MLSELVNMIKQKQIVIWGVGAIQTDVEALFDLKVVVISMKPHQKESVSHFYSILKSLMK